MLQHQYPFAFYSMHYSVADESNGFFFHSNCSMLINVEIESYDYLNWIYHNVAVKLSVYLNLTVFFFTADFFFILHTNIINAFFVLFLFYFFVWFFSLFHNPFYIVSITAGNIKYYSLGIRVYTWGCGLETWIF